MFCFIQDFDAIGIKKRGFQLKLAKEAKKLHSTKFEVKVPVSCLNVTSSDIRNTV